MPGKTRFKSPVQNQDLLVDWNQLEANVDLDAAKFTVQVPQGLARCGGQPPSGGAAPAKPKS